MVGRERDHGAQAELHWLVLLEMRRRCSEMVGKTEEDDRGLLLPADDWPNWRVYPPSCPGSLDL